MNNVDEMIISGDGVIVRGYLRIISISATVNVAPDKECSDSPINGDNEMIGHIHIHGDYYSYPNGEFGLFDLRDKKSHGVDFLSRGMFRIKNKTVIKNDGIITPPPLIISKLKELGYDVSEVE